MTTDTPPIKSVKRTFEVIHALWELREAGPSEIAAHLDLSTSTAHVYLQSLHSTGYVINDEGKYRLSYQFLRMGSRVKFRNRLFQISKEEIRVLAEKTNEMVTLIVEEMGEAVLLHQELGEESLDLGTYPGMRLPLHSHASGKVILAHMEANQVDKILGRGLEQVTEDTITDREKLLDELSRIKDRGYAIDWDQQINGMAVVAVPIFVNGDNKGALTISCPTGRIQNNTYQEKLLRKLREAADTISIKYEYGSG